MFELQTVLLAIAPLLVGLLVGYTSKRSGERASNETVTAAVLSAYASMLIVLVILPSAR